jgi:antitoxin component YwqK of YwqJK toxin-antitoxin module
MKTIVSICCICFFAVACFAQKTSTFGDTINNTDVKGLKQGYWEETTNGFLSKGQYLNDVKDGSWTTYTSKGIVSKVETYKLGKKEGITINIDDNGYFKGESYYMNDQLNGISRTYSVGARILTETNYKNGVINGTKKTFYESGKTQEDSYYRYGVHDSTTKWYNSKGILLAEYNYKNGVFNGVNKTYSDSGNVIKEETYTLNVLNGAYKEYFDVAGSKVKISGTYKNGLKDGDWIEFDEKGTVLQTHSWKKGEMKK